MTQYFPPTYKSENFHCLYCNVYAQQRWYVVSWFNSTQFVEIGKGTSSTQKTTVEVSVCAHCENSTLWLDEKIIYPPVRTAPPANSDLPDSVKAVYDEASDIANQSPRAACALLRLAVEMLLNALNLKGSINEIIKNLVADGLDPKIQQSLDIVRVTGNNAVHPGKIVFDDTTDVQTLFQLINIIADAFITQPKRIQEIYDNLPEDSKKEIEKRDGKKS